MMDENVMQGELTIPILLKPMYESAKRFPNEYMGSAPFYNQKTVEIIERIARLEANLALQVQDTERWRTQWEKAQAECRLLWTALTNEVSVDRIKALSTAVVLGRLATAGRGGEITMALRDYYRCKNCDAKVVYGPNRSEEDWEPYLLCRDCIAQLERDLATAREQLARIVVPAIELLDVMETCHVCKGALELEQNPVHCEDCSYDCDAHEGNECVTICELHRRLRKALPPAHVIDSGLKP